MGVRDVEYWAHYVEQCYGRAVDRYPPDYEPYVRRAEFNGEDLHELDEEFKANPDGPWRQICKPSTMANTSKARCACCREAIRVGSPITILAGAELHPRCYVSCCHEPAWEREMVENMRDLAMGE